SRSRDLAVVTGVLFALAVGARAAALGSAWPAPDGRNLAALDRLRRHDPAVRVFSDGVLRSRGQLGGRLRNWNAFYLRRFETVEPGGLPERKGLCSFLITSRPDTWAAADAGLAEVERVEISVAAAGDLRLVVFDLCGGR